MSESKAEQLKEVRAKVRAQAESGMEYYTNTNDAAILEAEIVRLEKDLARAISRWATSEKADNYGDAAAVCIKHALNDGTEGGPLLNGIRVIMDYASDLRAELARVTRERDRAIEIAEYRGELLPGKVSDIQTCIVLAGQSTELDDMKGGGE